MNTAYSNLYFIDCKFSYLVSNSVNDDFYWFLVVHIYQFVNLSLNSKDFHKLRIIFKTNNVFK